MAVTYTPKCVEGFNTSNLYNKIRFLLLKSIEEPQPYHKLSSYRFYIFPINTLKPNYHVLRLMKYINVRR